MCFGCKHEDTFHMSFPMVIWSIASSNYRIAMKYDANSRVSNHVHTDSSYNSDVADVPIWAIEHIWLNLGFPPGLLIAWL